MKRYKIIKIRIVCRLLKIRFLFVFLLWLFGSLEGRAQVFINLQIPEGGTCTLNQLWSLTLTNTSNTSLNLKLDLILTDATNGNLILSGNTNPFTVLPGIKTIQLNDITPIQYNVVNSFYGISASPIMLMPVGNYTVCISVSKLVGELYENIVEDCQMITIEPLSPPILSLPEDQSAIDNNKPLFTWLPPSPLTMFANLSYQFVLVEVYPSQTSFDAVQNNVQIVFQQGVQGSTLQYPLTLPMLDTGKLYAWQVKAENNLQAVAESEVFVFSLKTDTVLQNIEGNIYIKLRSPDDPPFTIARGWLKYEYLNRMNNAQISLKLFDITDMNHIAISLPESLINIQYGDNFLDLKLSDLHMQNDHQYIFIVTGETVGDKQALKFIYKQED